LSSCFAGLSETLKPSVIETHKVGDRIELRGNLAMVVDALGKQIKLPDS
jgi:hypothetical protein